MSESYENIIDPSGRVIGRRLVSDGAGLPVQYKTYFWGDFLEALTDNELDALLALQATSAPLQRFIARVEARGQVDCNLPKVQQALTYLVNQNVLTAPRALELRG